MLAEKTLLSSILMIGDHFFERVKTFTGRLESSFLGSNTSTRQESLEDDPFNNPIYKVIQESLLNGEDNIDFRKLAEDLKLSGQEFTHEANRLVHKLENYKMSRRYFMTSLVAGGFTGSLVGSMKVPQIPDSVLQILKYALYKMELMNVDTYIAINKPLTLYTDQSVKSESILTIPANSTNISILDDSKIDWIKVGFKGSIGWIFTGEGSYDQSISQTSTEVVDKSLSVVKIGMVDLDASSDGVPRTGEIFTTVYFSINKPDGTSADHISVDDYIKANNPGQFTNRVSSTYLAAESNDYCGEQVFRIADSTEEAQKAGKQYFIIMDGKKYLVERVDRIATRDLNDSTIKYLETPGDIYLATCKYKKELDDKEWPLIILKLVEIPNQEG